MKTKVNIILAAISAFLTGCSFSLFAQGQSQSSAHNNPDVQIIVHKQTDANGNVISYDSTYTYIYSGKRHNEAYVDSIMKKHELPICPGKALTEAEADTMLKEYMRGLDVDYMYLSMPWNNPGISNYPFIQQPDEMDFDKMQQIMQNKMKEMMQIYGMPPCNGFFCQPPPAHQCCPKDSVKYTPQPAEKKSCPKHNNVKGSTQI